MKKIIAISFLLLAMGPKPQKSRDTIDGFVSMHNGPNCYNAAFLWLEYVDEIRQTGNVEARYYLENFCHEVPRSPTPNDLIALIRNDEGLEHAAVLLGGNQIFEKGNSSGKYGGVAEAESDSVYKSKSLSESPYFNGGRDQGPLVRQFRCMNAAPVKQLLAPFWQLPAAAIFQIFFREIEKTNSQFDLSLENHTEAFDALKKMPNILHYLSGTEDEAVFLLALADSVNSHLGNLETEMLIRQNGSVIVPKEWYDTRQSLWHEMKALRQRIKSSQNDQKTQRILNEMGPY